jgi:hypothetical protein
MALDTYTWEIVAGDDESVTFDFESSVAAYTFTCQIRERRGQVGDPIVTATCTPASDTCVVTLTDTQTRTLGDYGRRRFWADLQQDNGSTRTTLFYISVIVQKDVSR